MTKLKILEVLIGQDIGEYKSALWFAVDPRPLNDIDVMKMKEQNRSGELAQVGERVHWMMGRIVNPKWNTPYPIVDAVARELTEQEPNILSQLEYRFKVVRL